MPAPTKLPVALALAGLLLPTSRLAADTLAVSDSAAFRATLADVRAGTTIRLAPGTYRGSFSTNGLRGEPGKPIVIEAADPKRPPVIEGGTTGLHLSSPSHVELRHLVFAGASGNGINIDDGGKVDRPAHHVVLRDLTVRDVGPKGNCDDIKLSGVDDFTVEGCTVERWGSGGSGIDMVGCHRGRIVGSTFRHGDRVGDNAVQAKGGSRDIVVSRCRFEHAGSRAINIGGSTGRPFFRPRLEGFEAKDITVEDCTIIGSDAALAFVGVDGALVHHNTIIRPRRYAFRILQESTGPEFVPCREGRFTDNLIVFRPDEMTAPVNIGPGTAPKTFIVARNAWYCEADSIRSEPRWPPEIKEAAGTYGNTPKFLDPAQGDYRQPPDSPSIEVGARR